MDKAGKAAVLKVPGQIEIRSYLILQMLSRSEQPYAGWSYPVSAEQFSKNSEVSLFEFA